jgi:uncharacterized protein
MKSALIIFVRNPVLSKVKTRLAATTGDEKALLVYKYLLQYTQSITKDLPVTKFVYYADFINENDLWNGYEKKIQQGNDLGDRMKNAFAALFTEGYRKVCIIGSDCYELSGAIIIDAFENLKTTDVVIGPVNDGGYYLLGTAKLVTDFFINKNWSTSTVYSSTLKDAENLQLTVSRLPLLNDIDEEKDLIQSSIAYLLDK